MKRFLSVLVTLSLLFLVVACKPRTYEVALVTDVGTISDQSFNQAAWEGVKKFGDEFKVSYQYYQPTCTGTGCEVQDADRERSIKSAVNAGAKIIVLPGFLFGSIIDKMADAYKEVLFVGIDVTSNTPKTNVLGIYFRDYEAGFVAGYSVVMEGLHNIGFMGGMSVPAVKEYGTGYIAGALLAAKEKELANFKFPDNRYTYLNSFMPDNNHKTKATSWYNDGTDVIFACAGGAGLSVNEAAKEANKHMVGVDVDQAYLSEQIVTSAVKKMTLAVYEALKEYKDGNFEGQTIVKGIKENGSGIASFETSRFKTFTKAQHDALIERILATENPLVVPQTYDELVTFAAGLGYSEVDYPSRTTVEG